MKNLLIRRVTSVILGCSLLFFGAPMNINAAQYNGSSVISNNIHEHVYTANSKVAQSYMIANPDGTVSRIENFGDILLHEKYNSSFKVAYQGVLSLELPRFGGVYSGVNYNYIVFGQDNMAQNDTTEVIRIVKYNKAWQRVGAISVKACNTTVPFTGSNADLAEYGNYIYFRCSHQTYKDAAGAYHQGSMTICARTDNNSVVAVSSAIGGLNAGNLEGSGAQYIDATDGIVTVAEKNNLVTGSAVWTRYVNGVGSATFSGGTYYVSALGKQDALTSIVPEFSIGGYETSSQCHLIVGNSSPMDGTSPNKNVTVVAVPRNNCTKQATSVSYLTGFAQGSVETVETPYLVKLNDNLFAILWEQRQGYSDMCKVYYTFINGMGQRVTDTASIDGCLSDCQPVVYAGNIVWYTTNGAAMKIYTIPVSGSSTAVTYNSGTNATTGYSAIYDYNYYMNRYPDIRVLYGNNEAGALQHFLTSGMAEGRVGCANFDPTIYKANYPDLAAAFGNNWPQYYQHYMNSGYSEGRNGARKLK